MFTWRLLGSMYDSSWTDCNLSLIQASISSASRVTCCMFWLSPSLERRSTKAAFNFCHLEIEKRKEHLRSNQPFNKSLNQPCSTVLKQTPLYRWLQVNRNDYSQLVLTRNLEELWFSPPKIMIKITLVDAYKCNLSLKERNKPAALLTSRCFRASSQVYRRLQEIPRLLHFELTLHGGSSMILTAPHHDWTT